MVSFVHLNAQSSFSLLEGASPVKRLVELAGKDRQPALGLTDRGNLFGALEFAETAANAGIQPINGLMLRVEEAEARAGMLTLLAATEDGLENLVTLASQAYLEGEKPGGPEVSLEALAPLSGGLICLAGGPESTIFQALISGQNERAEVSLAHLKNLFGDRLYLEVQRHRLPEEQRAEAPLVALAHAEELPFVATQQALFPSTDYYAAHDALICIEGGKLVSDHDRKHFSPEHYFKTQAEMGLLFADLPEALENTVEIAERCHARLVTRAPMLPRFGNSASNNEAELIAFEAKELRKLAEEGLQSRLENFDYPEGFTRADYEERLQFELGVIEQMQFPGYFLVVAEFIGWAKSKGIPVGPGRGSGAASVVAWSLRITGLDPLRFSLLFERFLNPERVSMPDFDIDFCQDRRDEVIRHVQERYGDDRVAHIITFGSLQARAALRDIGRVLEMPYGQVDRLCKLVPFNPANPVSLEEAVNGEAKLREARREEEVVDKLITYSIKLEGLYRHASTHAAGVVISGCPLQELVPLYRDPRSHMPVTQYNMKWVEQAGLVKFDFLGLRTLSIIREAEHLAKKKGIEFSIDDIPLDDELTYEKLRSGETVGVFQLESAGMRRTVLDMKPSVFTDLIALVALYRPGPMQNIPTFCNRKHGKEEIDYLHPMLEPVLKETYGVIVYQEQVLQIAQILAGYSLGEADLLRKAMGKKIKSEMDAHRSRFADGAEENKISREEAEKLFDLIARFADYGFNKAHSAAYGLISYQTAWLKCKHPAELLAASMTYESGNTDRVRDFWMEAKRLGVQVAPPSVQNSGARFDVREGTVHYSLAALKGVGESAAEHIAQARGGKPFADLEDWMRRTDPKMLNKRTFEGLIAAGAFDDFGIPRERLSANSERILSYQNRLREEEESGQSDLFGGGNDAEAALALELKAADPWPADEKLKREYAAVGFFISGHPLDDYQDYLTQAEVPSFAQFVATAREGKSHSKLAASVISAKEKQTRNGGKMGILELSDATSQFEAVLFSEAVAEYRDILTAGELLLLDVEAEITGEETRVRVSRARRLTEIANSLATEGKVTLTFTKADDLAALAKVRGLLRPGTQCQIEMRLPLAAGEARQAHFALPGRYSLPLASLKALRELDGLAVQVNEK